MNKKKMIHGLLVLVMVFSNLIVPTIALAEQNKSTAEEEATRKSETEEKSVDVNKEKTISDSSEDLTVTKSSRAEEANLTATQIYPDTAPMHIAKNSDNGNWNPTEAEMKEWVSDVQLNGKSVGDDYTVVFTANDLGINTKKVGNDYFRITVESGGASMVTRFYFTIVDQKMTATQVYTKAAPMQIAENSDKGNWNPTEAEMKEWVSDVQVNGESIGDDYNIAFTEEVSGINTTKLDTNEYTIMISSNEVRGLSYETSFNYKIVNKELSGTQVYPADSRLLITKDSYGGNWNPTEAEMKEWVSDVQLDGESLGDNYTVVFTVNKTGINTTKLGSDYYRITVSTPEVRGLSYETRINFTIVDKTLSATSVYPDSSPMSITKDSHGGNWSPTPAEMNAWVTAVQLDGESVGNDYTVGFTTNTSGIDTTKIGANHVSLTVKSGKYSTETEFYYNVEKGLTATPADPMYSTGDQQPTNMNDWVTNVLYNDNPVGDDYTVELKTEWDSSKSGTYDYIVVVKSQGSETEVTIPVSFSDKELTVTQVYPNNAPMQIEQNRYDGKWDPTPAEMKEWVSDVQLDGESVGDDYTVEFTVQKIGINTTILGPDYYRITVKSGNYSMVTRFYFNVYEKEKAPIAFDLNYVGVNQQKVVGFLPTGVTTDQLNLYLKKSGEETWQDTGYSGTADNETGYFAIESRFVKGEKTFLLENQDQVKVVFTGSDGNVYEGIKVVQPYTAPSVDSYTAGDDYTTGTVPNGANYVRLAINDIQTRTVAITPTPTTSLPGNIDAKTGDFKIYAKNYSSTGKVDNPDNKIIDTKVGDTLTLDYGVQIYGVQNNPSTTIIAK